MGYSVCQTADYRTTPKSLSKWIPDLGLQDITSIRGKWLRKHRHLQELENEHPKPVNEMDTKAPRMFREPPGNCCSSGQERR
jgi:hypothetical protein